MLSGVKFRTPKQSNTLRGRLLAWAAVLLLPVAASGQSWTWTTDTVDKNGSFASLAADRQGNLHVSYISHPGGVTYGFRPAGSSHWFTMLLGKADDGYTRIALDDQGNPSVCFNAFEMFSYSRFQDGQWISQQVAADSGPISFSCSVAIGPDGTPHLAWYQYKDRDRSDYLHIKYAALRDGVWLARTIDFDGETGKWNSMVLDAQGNPHLAYSCWGLGELKYAYWNGKSWVVTAVDSRQYSKTSGNRGMANSLVLGPDGLPRISYFEEHILKYAHRQGNTWKIEIVDTLSPLVGVGWAGPLSSLVLDRRGTPHIFYGDFGALKHAYWDGQKWRIQVIEVGGAGVYKYTSATIDANDTINVSYKIPSDDTLKIATGRLMPQAQTAEAPKQNKN